MLKYFDMCTASTVCDTREKLTCVDDLVNETYCGCLYYEYYNGSYCGNIFFIINIYFYVYSAGTSIKFAHFLN